MTRSEIWDRVKNHEPPLIEILDEPDSARAMDIIQKNLRPAGYNLSASRFYYDYAERSIKKVRGRDNKIRIPPGHVVMVWSREAINMPNDILCTVHPRASLTLTGLSHVATLIDPGWPGLPIGIVFKNYGPRVVCIEPGEPIARLVFHKLSRPLQENERYKSVRNGKQHPPYTVCAMVRDMIRNGKVESESFYKILQFLTEEYTPVYRARRRKLPNLDEIEDAIEEFGYPLDYIYAGLLRAFLITPEKLWNVQFVSFLLGYIVAQTVLYLLFLARVIPSLEIFISMTGAVIIFFIGLMIQYWLRKPEITSKTRRWMVR